MTPINRPIRNDTEHAEALREIDRLMDAAPDTPDGDRLDLPADLLVQEYALSKAPVRPRQVA